MFTLADNREIGRYLKEQIDEKYESSRAFARKYLEVNKQVADEVAVVKMNNRLTQIKKGKKGVQLYDLPAFTLLLDISCEELLSAGKCRTPFANRLTNCFVARTNDKGVWKAYAERPDAPILNLDEYGKNIIEYALEFENYGLLSYLMEQDYIYFVGPDEKDYVRNFGAGVKVQRSAFPPQPRDPLIYQMAEDQSLRLRMLLLAVKRGDLEMLKRLHAREIPAYYQASALSRTTPAEIDGRRRNSIDETLWAAEQAAEEELLDAIAEADEKTLAYFAEEFEIKNMFSEVNRFLYPRLPELAARLLEKGNISGARLLLQSAVEHNRNAYAELAELMRGSVEAAQTRRPCWVGEREQYDERMTAQMMSELECKDGYVLYRDPAAKQGVVTNLLRMPDDASADGETGRLIQVLNGCAEKVCALRPDIEGRAAR